MPSSKIFCRVALVVLLLTLTLGLEARGGLPQQATDRSRFAQEEERVSLKRPKNPLQASFELSLGYTGNLLWGNSGNLTDRKPSHGVFADLRSYPSQSDKPSSYFARLRATFEDWRKQTIEGIVHDEKARAKRSMATIGLGIYDFGDNLSNIGSYVSIEVGACRFEATTTYQPMTSIKFTTGVLRICLGLEFWRFVFECGMDLSLQGKKFRPNNADLLDPVYTQTKWGEKVFASGFGYSLGYRF
ncbi:MAG: hypothetical protein FWG02_00365 [Holophagaceae bacterium]|nr:hypothetical protein [Holophagaceae bacterium]